MGPKAARNPPARIVPSSPPGGSAPRTSGITWTSTSSDESEAKSIVKPTTFVTGASSNWLRNHFIATKNIPMGNKNAAKPQNWKKRSARCAPTGPIQFRAGPEPGAGADTLNDASCGEYDSRLSVSRIARLNPTNPISSLIRLFSVGVKMRKGYLPLTSYGASKTHSCSARDRH